MVVGLAAGAIAAAVLVPGPAQSSVPGLPPVLPSFEGDIVIPPEDAVRTIMPRYVHQHGATTYRQGMYDVHVLVVATDDGPPPWNEVEARSQVEAMDAWYASHTRGAYRFRMASFREIPPFVGKLCGSISALEHAAPEISEIRVSPGATDALPVVVAVKPRDCPANGQANLGSPGAWVSEDPEWPAFTLPALIHEVGHNLGLEHSTVIKDPVDVGDPWPAGQTPELVEYGDATDIMGGAVQWLWNGVGFDFRPSGLHAHHRNVLGALDATEVGFVAASAEPLAVVFDLVPVNSEAPGVRAKYLPWLNRSKFMLEYRNSSGSDSWLGLENGTGTGVIVRLLDTDLSSGPEPYPRETDATYYLGTAAWPSGVVRAPNDRIPLGLKQGHSTRLTDGTLVEVLSTDANGAKVRMTRPADVTPPTMSPPRIEYTGGACTRYPCTVPAKASKKGRYRLLIVFGAMDDNQWVASAQVAVNGTPVFAAERPAPDGTDEETAMSPGSRGWGGWRTYPSGRHTVTYTYTDLVGNEGSSSFQLILPKTVR